MRKWDCLGSMFRFFRISSTEVIYTDYILFQVQNCTSHHESSHYNHMESSGEVLPKTLLTEPEEEMLEGMDASEV